MQIVEAEQVSDLGSEGVLFELNYAWRAKLLKRLKPPRRFDPDENEFKEYDERFNLWQVDVTVGEGTYQRSWQYEEVSWHK